MLKAGIKITAELFPNLVLHVMSVAGIGTEYDMEYGEKFKETLTLEERSILLNMRDEFKRVPPTEASPLYQFLFHIPCYFPAENIDEIANIYDLVKESIEKSSLTPFEKLYPSEMEMVHKHYFTREFESFIFTEVQSKISEINKSVDTFKNIVTACCRRFYVNYWQEVKAKTEPIINKIFEKIDNVNLVREWSDITRLQFPFPRFHAILCEPTKSLATSLQAEKVIFSSRRKIDEIVDIIIHEVGTHIFFQKALFETEKLRQTFFEDPNGLVRIIEVASEYLRKPISNKLEIDSKLSVTQFFRAENEYKIFQRVYEGGNYEDIYEAILFTYNENKENTC